MTDHVPIAAQYVVDELERDGPLGTAALIDRYEGVAPHRALPLALGRADDFGWVTFDADGYSLTETGRAIQAGENVAGRRLAHLDEPDTSTDGELVADGWGAEITDPDHRRLQPGQSHRRCPDCGEAIVVGHAVHVQAGGLVHEDCDDPWCGLFDEEDTEAIADGRGRYAAAAEPPAHNCENCSFDEPTERTTCPHCGGRLFPNVVAFNRGVRQR